MGQAKRKLEEVRKACLEELEQWSFQSTEWETRTVAEIQTLPIVKVKRYPESALSYMRMVARQCHKNAEFMEKNDPRGIMKHVTGWWIQESNYVLHSIIQEGDQFICVTPAPLETTDMFDFVPDLKIEWRDQGDVRAAYRDDVEIGSGVRADAARTIVELKIIKENFCRA